MTAPKSAALEPIIGTLGATAPRPTARVQMRTRAKLAEYHLQAAAAFARQTHVIQAENEGRPFGAGYTPVFWHASSSLIMSATALEALVNELIRDILDDKSRPTDIRGRARSIMNRDMKVPRNQSEISFKYQEVARLHGAKLDQTLPECASTRALISFRNTLIHFKPAWDDDVHHKKVSALLDREFNKHASLVFPLGYLTYSGAKWGVITVRRFSAYYAQLIEVTDNFVAPWLDLELPSCDGVA